MDVDYNSDPIQTAAIEPDFFDSPHLSRLYAMFIGLCEELAVTNERQDTLVDLLVQDKVITRDALDSYRPTPSEIERRTAKHKTMIKMVMQDFESELNSLKDQ